MVKFFAFGLMVLAVRDRTVKCRYMIGKLLIELFANCSLRLLLIFVDLMFVGAAMKPVTHANRNGV
ncbi:hypothetical protein D3C86_2172670 [compost metagenome]